MKYLFLLFFLMSLSSCAIPLSKKIEIGPKNKQVNVHSPITIIKDKYLNTCRRCVPKGNVIDAVSKFSIEHLEKVLSKKIGNHQTNIKLKYFIDYKDDIVDKCLMALEKSIHAKKKGGHKILNKKSNICANVSGTERMDCIFRSQDDLEKFFEKGKRDSLTHLIVPVNIFLYIPYAYEVGFEYNIQPLYSCYVIFDFIKKHVSFRYYKTKGIEHDDFSHYIIPVKDNYKYGFTDADLQFLNE